MTSRQIRRTFLEFFRNKGHKIVPSAPIVNKNDPTLMFTNAGMNQFKDYFLGNQVPDAKRVADTQKCLRVSGKHNDLEEVGRDGYHHTMFEMLGNWSFGDYFKEEAIAWAWELLTEVYGLPKDRLYATVFGGDEAEGLERDQEAADIWKKYVPEDRILFCGKKDNFWEMGDQGPCGPCSEIHIDLRSDEERQKKAGAELVNMDNPEVIEIWNLVFIQYNRKADSSLEPLPARHVDTGMGFERLTMTLQGKNNTYDTDIFQPIIQFIENESGFKYTGSFAPEAKTDIAMRVVADHIRAVAFTIADGQLPGNTGAGYVIRRILRRAVRYYYSFLNIKSPFLYRIVPLLAGMFEEVFPELKAQESQVARIIKGEESAFLNTLENGLRRFAELDVQNGTIAGEDAFELYDTYGFPIDLTRLMAEEKGWKVDEEGFEKAMQAQKQRARAAAEKEVGDWQLVAEADEVNFVGYDTLKVENARVVRYREVKTKKGSQIQLVLDQTPFYGESGGQRGDKGWLEIGGEKVRVLDTQKENDLIIHIVEKLPAQIDAPVLAQVDPKLRAATAANHSATHLMHAALHKVLGSHATQKGQDVDHQRLRFDFNHFQKVTDEELKQIEALVNEKIRQNIQLEEERNVPIEEAKASGAMMLFGEKYGDLVRIITFDRNFSRELCGGTHVKATGEIGFFKIVSESAVAAGVRRIEALTAANAEQFLQKELETLHNIRVQLKHPKDPVKAISSLQEEVKNLQKETEQLIAAQANALKKNLLAKAEKVNGITLLTARLPIQDSAALKNLAYQLDAELENAVIVFGAEVKGKPQLLVAINKSLTESNSALHAGQLIRELAKEIKGGGGGQPFFATAGGKDAGGLDRALEKAREMVAGQLA
ncbi:MAG: alanine--tRNA ligase [Saprospirales bacterium]|nr:alanine--tRNA ligase [Saprospirales bacterium]